MWPWTVNFQFNNKRRSGANFFLKIKRKKWHEQAKSRARKKLAIFKLVSPKTTSFLRSKQLMFFSFYLSLILMSGIRKLGLLSPKIWYNSWVFNEDQISRYSALQGFNPLCFACLWVFCHLSNFLWDLHEAKISHLSTVF